MIIEHNKVERRKAFASAVLCLTLGIIWGIMALHDSNQFYVIPIYLISIIFVFGAVDLLSHELMNKIKNTPPLEINEDGIMDYSCSRSIGSIKWEEISYFELRSPKGIKKYYAIAVFLKDESRIKKSMSGILWMIIWIFRKISKNVLPLNAYYLNLFVTDEEMESIYNTLCDNLK